MNKKEERDNFGISVGPESGYLGTIAEETARKNSGGISPDGERLGWKNAHDSHNKAPSATNAPGCDCGTDCDCPPCHCPPCDNTKTPNGDSNQAPNCDCPPNGSSNQAPNSDCPPNCNCAPGCTCTPEYNDTKNATDYLPIWANSNEGYLEPMPGMIPTPQPDLGPERQNTLENE